MPDLTPRYLDGQQFDVEDQGGVRWNHAAGAARDRKSTRLNSSH